MAMRSCCCLLCLALTSVAAFWSPTATRTNRKFAKHIEKRSCYIVATEDISAEELEVALLTEERLLLDVYATWCGPCALLAPEIDILAQTDAQKNTLDGVTRAFGGRVRIVKFDADQEPGGPEMATTLGVGALPCLLFLSDGEEAHRVEGALQATRIAELMDGVWFGGEMPRGPEYGDV